MMKKIWLNINIIITRWQQLTVETQWKNIDEQNWKKINDLKHSINYQWKLSAHKICKIAKEIVPTGLLMNHVKN